jgi:predicted GNAT family acetyltransferase
VGAEGPAALAAGLDGGAEGAIVATVGLKVGAVPRGLDVSYLFVDPQWRGRGLATLLLRAALKYAAAAGAPAVRLLTITVYAAALSLYRNFFFKEYKRRETVGLYTLVHLELKMKERVSPPEKKRAGEGARVFSPPLGVRVGGGGNASPRKPGGAGGEEVIEV